VASTVTLVHSAPVTDQIVAHAAKRREAKQPFVGRIIRSTTLTGSGSEKHTENHEISLEGSGVTYLPGDALGVYPANDPAQVARVIERLGATGTEIVCGAGGESVTLADALTTKYAIASPSRRLLELMVARGAADLAPLLLPENTAAFKEYVGGRQAHDVLDVLETFRTIHLEPAEFVATLRTLLPRLYSIASSQRVYPNTVHIIVVSVAYTLRTRRRTGVASTWLNDRAMPNEAARFYVQDQQKHFALPADSSRPLIMVGPGTGVAPFRAFIQDRRASGARGPNWLFFGEQRRSSDYFYESEFTEYEREGLLRIDTAFSRDQAEKIYVQHRMRERSREVFEWLENGAAFYVCGDKERMAADVDRELHHIVETEGSKTSEQAKEYVERLRAEKRYQRDVY
jgi:sulfite reductase (NADPH) flavoprotein alpha-component